MREATQENEKLKKEVADLRRQMERKLDDVDNQIRSQMRGEIDDLEDKVKRLEGQMDQVGH